MTIVSIWLGLALFFAFILTLGFHQKIHIYNARSETIHVHLVGKISHSNPLYSNQRASLPLRMTHFPNYPIFTREFTIAANESQTFLYDTDDIIASDILVQTANDSGYVRIPEYTPDTPKDGMIVTIDALSPVPADFNYWQHDPLRLLLVYVLIATPIILTVLRRAYANFAKTSRS